MELVYLWVEEYKNIKNQGFNFSPRFECKYNKDSNKLTIDEKEDYVSIFPENINVTAIVGENGSGKSSLAQILAYYNRGDFSKLNNSFLIFVRKNNFFSLNTNNLSSNVEIRKDTRIPFLSYFANEITTFLNDDYPLSFKNYNKLDAMKDSSKQYMMPNNKYLNINKEKILEIELFNDRFQKILSNNKNLFQQVNQSFIFNNKKREIHFYEICGDTADSKNPINKLWKVSPYAGHTIFDDNIPFEDTPHQTYFYKYLILNRLMYIERGMGVNLEKLIEDIKESFQKEILEDSDYTDMINKMRNANPINDNNYDLENIKKVLENFEYRGENIWIEKESTNISDEYLFKCPLLETINQNNTIRTNYFHDNNENYNYFSLSSGEREYIKLFTHIIYHLQREDRRDVFFLDEPDIALHPNWQKKLIKDLVHFTKEYTEEKSIQLVLTSHSSFILSDIPKEHAVFLQDFKQKKPFKDKQTFGANIHTLLSHGFFMEDGLMGEFAKGKIEEIKKFYELLKKLETRILSNTRTKGLVKKSFEKRKKIFYHIQSIIGEPFLQTIIKNYLDEIELILSEDNTLIDNEILHLEAKIQKLKSLKND